MKRKTEHPEIIPSASVESQVDARFTPLYALIHERHHEAILNVEHDMIYLLKSAMRLPATEPVPADPQYIPFDSANRLLQFLSPADQRAVRAAQKKRASSE